MQKINEIKQKIPCDYYQFHSLTGVVIIPIKKSPPVLVFKDYGAPFYWETGGPDETRKGFEQPEALTNYSVYWKGKYFNHELPKEVQNEYGDFFTQLVETPLPTYLVEEFPKESVEIPIPLLRSKIVLYESKYLTYTKRILRKLGFLKQTQGKNKKKFSAAIAFRDRKIVQYYKELGSPKRFPIKKISEKLQHFFNRTTRDETPLFDDKIRRISTPSDTHIRRILKRCKSKSNIK